MVLVLDCDASRESYYRSLFFSPYHDYLITWFQDHEFPAFATIPIPWWPQCLHFLAFTFPVILFEFSWLCSTTFFTFFLTSFPQETRSAEASVPKGMSRELEFKRQWVGFVAESHGPVPMATGLNGNLSAPLVGILRARLGIFTTY